ncbi:ABC transporter substrate-binding protein [Acuticoccus sp. M5D2P5]|uniref:ABC transporter substrate-binding protein n=1 Tax=Acuticoccus kalidii TaxID=2910977 RepID=UPI001F43E349|nr:ABC transporter substrate-binding protein [Acuticoccus kalidii]
MLIAGASSHAFAQDGALEPATLRLNYVANAEHAPYYVGLEKGFYADAGIDITITPGIGSNDTVKLVGSGNDMFGVAVADAVAIGRSRGVPVVATAVLLQQSPNVMISLKDSGIETPEDLYGKTVGVSSRSTVFAFWGALVDAAGLDASQIELTDLGTTSSSPVLIAGTIDATITLATNEVIALQEDGFDLNVIDLGDYGVNSYGQVLFANEAVVADNPDLAKRFTEATLRSWEYTIENVDEAIEILKKHVPETEIQKETAKWTEIIPRTRAASGDVPFGAQSVEGWQSTYETFASAGLIDTAYDPADLIANLD